MFQVTTVLPPPHEKVGKIPTAAPAAPPKKKEAAEDGTTGEKKEETKAEPAPFHEKLVNYKKDLFGKPSFLTVSGQLSVENYCCALSDVYTFGPTFRAENSHTSRHLSEFWMIEPELAFATLEDDMSCAEDYLKFCLQYVLKNNAEELAFFDQFVEKGLIARLKQVIDTPFRRVAYTEAITILEGLIADKKVKFENKVYWGVDLASEHERHLTEKVFQGPIILYNYPKDIKAFYMKLNEDGKTVQAMDVLVPRIGEIIGGSAREEDLEKLDKRIEECKLEKEAYWWYRELREYGTVPHAGFGLGFERLVMMATGIENIRDVIPFPRAPGQAEF
jgi:asparaginyl-tRNA synthetase